MFFKKEACCFKICKKIKPALYIESFVESRIYLETLLYLLKQIIRAILACPKNILCYIIWIISRLVLVNIEAL